MISGPSQMGGQNSKKHPDYHFAYYTGGLTAVLLHWMQDADRVTSDELIDLPENDFALLYFNG